MLSPKTDADLLQRTNDDKQKVSGAHNGNVLSNEIANKRNEKSTDQTKSQPTDANNDVTLTRTLARNSYGTINAQNIAKSWYARCHRWRSQSCDRRKNASIRYSWNANNNRPA